MKQFGNPLQIKMKTFLKMVLWFFCRVPNYKLSTIILVDIAEGFGAIFSANIYLLLQFYFISTNWYILTFIDDLNASIRDLNRKYRNQKAIEKSLINIIKFHESILKKQNQIAKFMSQLIYISNIFNQMIMFSTMYQIYIVSLKSFITIHLICSNKIYFSRWSIRIT